MKEQLNMTMLCAVLALSSACLGGCGMQGGVVGEPSDATASQIPPMAEGAENDNAPRAEEAQTAAPFNLDGVIEQTVLLDDDALTIVAEKLEYRNDMAYLTLSFTNNTEGELDVMTSTLGYSANYVNGCMMTEGHLSAQIPGGETAEEEVGYSLWELQLYGMKGIGTLGLGVRAVNDEFEEVFKGIVEVTTSLYGEDSIDSGTFAGFVDSPAFSQRLGYDVEAASSIDHSLGAAGLDALSAFLLTNQEGERAVMVELMNNTDDALIVHVSDVSINGALAYEGPWTADTVAPGKRFVIDDLLLSSMVEDKADEFDLSKVGDVSMTISITDANRNTILDSADLTVSF